MRIFRNCLEAVKEVERDLWELGTDVHPHTMQDKVVKDDEDYKTKEITPYGFQITNTKDKSNFIEYMYPNEAKNLLTGWCSKDFLERTSNRLINPGEAWGERAEVWGEFIHQGRFHYTYNERIRVQLPRIIEELQERPPTRQAIINIHNNIMDLSNVGGRGRIPCSMYYNFMIREGKLNCVYTMRSCDFLTHFAFDNWHAISLQGYIANTLGIESGIYTYFTSSLHAYHKDMKQRGIF